MTKPEPAKLYRMQGPAGTLTARLDQVTNLRKKGYRFTNKDDEAETAAKLAALEPKLREAPTKKGVNQATEDDVDAMRNEPVDDDGADPDDHAETAASIDGTDEEDGED